MPAEASDARTKAQRAEHELVQLRAQLRETERQLRAEEERNAWLTSELQKREALIARAVEFKTGPAAAANPRLTPCPRCGITESTEQLGVVECLGCGDIRTGAT